jgi:hypothetical protein
MRYIAITLIVAISSLNTYSQEPTSGESSSLESAYANAEEGQVSILEEYRTYPLNLNTASLEDLLSLGLLSQFQAQNLIIHRDKFGSFLAIQELQVISGWNLQLIRELIPYVTIQSSEGVVSNFKNRLIGIRQRALLRFGDYIPLFHIFNEPSSSNYYLGSNAKILFQYRIDKGRYLQAGITGDKDAGEYFFRKNNKLGFDFYGAYFFVRELKKIKSIAIGDYEINMGQGLIHWQSMAFKKSSDITKTERVSEFIRPHTSSGEYNFHRGIATEVMVKKINIGCFISVRSLSASVAFDSVIGKEIVSSINSSGYHRTKSEIVGKSSVIQNSFGCRVHYELKNAALNFNSIWLLFSKYLLKSDEPYNLYSIAGNHWQNHSIDYKFTYENFHFFGEYAIDLNKKLAMCNGVLIGVSSKVDLSFFVRLIDKKFQSVMSSAFTESTLTTNEKGFFAGVSIKPNSRWRVDAYSDFYQFPWLRYLSSFPLYGKDFLLQIMYQPDKKTQLITRLRSEMKPTNAIAGTITDKMHVAIRVQLNHSVSKSVSTKMRIEYLKLSELLSNVEHGYLFFWDIAFKPVLGKTSMSFRFEKFDTDSYDSRVYAYEPDLPGSFSLPAQSGTGNRLIYNVLYKVRSFCIFSMNISETFIFRKSLINSQKESFFPNNPVFKAQLQLVF